MVAGSLNRAVSVWVVDKRPQGLLGTLSPSEREAVLAVARADAAALARLKHPAVVQVRFWTRGAGSEVSGRLALGVCASGQLWRC